MQNFFDTHLSEGFKFIRLFDFVDDLVFLMKVDNTGFSYQYINQAVKEIVQIDESIMGNYLQEVVEDSDQLTVLLQYYQAVVDNKEPTKFVYEVINPTRQYVGDTSLYPIFDEQNECAFILAIVKDITEKYQLEKRLRENEERYRLIAENSLDVIKLIRTDGIIEYASPSSEVIVGFQPEVYIGKHFQDFLCPEDQAVIPEKFAAIVETKMPLTVEVKHRHADGHFIWMEIIATPVIKDGVVTQVVTSARDISERIEYREKLARMAFHDYLSGLPNRRLFEDRLEMALKQAERHGKKVGLLLIDGQNFKRINDTYGHEVGDEVIKRMARRLEHAVRQTDTVARLGGDEFGIVLPDLEDDDAATEVAHRIIQQFQLPCEINNQLLSFNVDIGLAVYPDHTKDQKELIRLADEAMYSTKADNHSTFSIYQPIVTI